MARHDFTPLTKLQNEGPAIFIRLLRLLWPDVRAALDKGHTIRLIRQRLGEAGISISYRQLCRYIARLRSEDQEVQENAIKAQRLGPPTTRADASVSELRPDPLARVRNRLIRENDPDSAIAESVRRIKLTLYQAWNSDGGATDG